MAASNATAHVLITESLKDIIASCRKMGRAYSPDNKDIHIAALEAQLTTTEYYQQIVKEKVNTFYDISNERTYLFSRLPALCQQLLQVLQDIPVPPGAFHEAERICLQIREARLYKHFSIAQYENMAGAAACSVEGRTYEQLEQLFAHLLMIIAECGADFQPKDEGLQYEALCDYLSRMVFYNGQILIAVGEVQAARINRNEVLPLLAEKHRELHKKVNAYLRRRK